MKGDFEKVMKKTEEKEEAKPERVTDTSVLLPPLNVPCDLKESEIYE